MKPAQRDSVEKVVPTKRAVRNDVRCLHFPAQEIRRINFQSAYGAPEVVDFDYSLPETTKSQPYFSCRFYELPSFIKRLVVSGLEAATSLFTTF